MELGSIVTSFIQRQGEAIGPISASVALARIQADRRVTNIVR